MSRFKRQTLDLAAKGMFRRKNFLTNEHNYWHCRYRHGGFKLRSEIRAGSDQNHARANFRLENP